MKHFAPSELIINEDGSAFHLHVRPEQIAHKIILVGDPGRVDLVASHFDSRECEIQSREFRTVTGTYGGKHISVLSTGIGCDNIDIVMNELDALVNIDFETRTEKASLTSLEVVRIGTCGGLQPFTPVGTFICSDKSIGFDGLLNPQVLMTTISPLTLSGLCTTAYPNASNCFISFSESTRFFEHPSVMTSMRFLIIVFALVFEQRIHELFLIEQLQVVDALA